MELHVRGPRTEAGSGLEGTHLHTLEICARSHARRTPLRHQLAEIHENAQNDRIIRDTRNSQVIGK